MIEVRVNTNGPYWQARWTDSLGRRRSKSLGDRSKVAVRAAKVLAKRLELELNNGLAVGEAPKLADHCRRYMGLHPDYSKGTAWMYEQTMRFVDAYFGPDCRLDRVSRSHAADFRAALVAGTLPGQRGKPSESTVCRWIREAKAIFQLAVDEDVLGKNPFSKLKSSPAEVDKDWPYISRPQLDKLLEACPSTNWRLLLSLCRLAGLRKGEAMGLEWADVDWQAHRLRINTGTVRRTTKKRRREVPMVGDLEKMLLDAQGHATYHVPTVIERVPIGGSFERAFRRVCRLAGVEPYHKPLHTLRKNCETDWLQTFDLLTVCQWVGHSPAVAQRHYHKAKDSDFTLASGTELARGPRRGGGPSL